MPNPSAPYAPGLTIAATYAQSPAGPLGLSDLFWVWQAGQLDACTGAQLIALVQSGGVVMAPVPNSALAQIANNTLKSNISGGTAVPADNTLSAILDAVIGSTEGNLLIRGASGWTSLAIGANGSILGSNGTLPAWEAGIALANLPSIGASTVLANISGVTATPAAVGVGGQGGILDALLGNTPGATLVRDPSAGWTILAPGSAGYVLVSNGAGNSPSYQSVAGTGTVTSINIDGSPVGFSFINGPITSSGILQISPSSVLNLANGGTGATSVAGAQNALGLGFLQNQGLTASAAALAINYALGSDISLSLGATVTSMTVSNWPPAGQLGRLLLEIANTGAFNITGYPGTVIWNAGSGPPTITSGAGKKDTILLTSNDGGNNFRGYVLAQNMS